MKEQVAKKILPILILASFLASQVLMPFIASADPSNGFTTPVSNPTLNYDNPNQSSGNNPYKISVNGILSSGLLTQVVSCTGIVNKVSKVTTEFIQNLITSKKEKAVLKAAQIKAATNAVKEVSPTSSDEILTAKQQAATDASSTRFEKCIDGIAVQLAKNQLTSMTKYTMNWINTGFNGNPMYVQDVSSFMNSIEDTILQKETNLFKDPANDTSYPYGRDFARSAISAQQASKNFAGSMKQDLTNYLDPGSTPQSFANDFSEGGWDGWLALTQHPQNNPLGFSMLETQHIADTQSQTVQQKTDEINRNQGYLDQSNCVAWQTIDKDNQPEYNEDGTESISTTVHSDICVKRATVTPGSTIKDKISTYVNSPERQLELAKTLNDSLNALFAALLNKFENQGLSSLSTSVNNYTGSQSAGLGVNQVFDALGNAISGGGNSGGTVSAGDGFFDLTRDLGNTYTTGITIDKRGVLQIQQDYIDKSKKLMAILPRVVSSIGELDYCIPGPNPNWQAISQDAIATYLDSLNNGAAQTIDPNTLDTDLSTYAAKIEAMYGTSSPMQDETAGNKFLKMSLEGLSITKDLSVDADTEAAAQSDYQAGITATKANIAKLNTIKDKVNAIIVAAQRRRATERSTAGLSTVAASCLSAEKVTYVENGQIK